MNDISNKILNSMVSFQKDTWSTISKEMTIKDVVEEIKGDIYRERIAKIRGLLAEGDEEAFKAEKLKLPAVTFSATFQDTRKKENIKEYNHLVVIDIDKLTKERLQIVVECLQKDKYVFCFWISPSNNGIKGIVPLEFNFTVTDIDTSHKSGFEKLATYFLNQYDIQLDRSGSDTTRLCFMSSDSALYIKNSVDSFEIEQSDIIAQSSILRVDKQKIKLYNTTKNNALFNPQGKNKAINKRAMKDIISYLTKRRIVVTGEYENRYRIAYAIANTFTFDLGINFYLQMCKIEFSKYNEAKERSLLEYCYENNTGWTKFIYIEELVKTYGYVKRTLGEAVS